VTTARIIYCSGPLFCPEEKAGMSRIAGTLEAAGFTTFLPQRDGLERYVLPFADGPAMRLPGSSTLGNWLGTAVFDLDVYQIVERCHALVANLDGRVPDEGTVAEAAIAFAVGKPVVFHKDDVRRPFGFFDNSMLVGLSSAPMITRCEELPGHIEHALSPQEHDFPSRDRVLPPRLRLAVRRGRRIWSLLSAFPADVPPDEAMRQVAEEMTRMEEEQRRSDDGP
jgi:nucleoside 2-deoxyribosyltransferase